jgi:hypothetical protein
VFFEDLGVVLLKPWLFAKTATFRNAKTAKSLSLS